MKDKDMPDTIDRICADINLLVELGYQREEKEPSVDANDMYTTYSRGGKQEGTYHVVYVPMFETKHKGLSRDLFDKQGIPLYGKSEYFNPLPF